MESSMILTALNIKHFQRISKLKLYPIKKGEKFERK